MAEKRMSPKAPESARTADEPAARVTKKQTMKKLSHEAQPQEAQPAKLSQLGTLP